MVMVKAMEMAQAHSAMNTKYTGEAYSCTISAIAAQNKASCEICTAPRMTRTGPRAFTRRGSRATSSPRQNSTITPDSA
jgi:hypothetical protein